MDFQPVAIPIGITGRGRPALNNPYLEIVAHIATMYREGREDDGAARFFVEATEDRRSVLTVPENNPVLKEIVVHLNRGGAKEGVTVRKSVTQRLTADGRGVLGLDVTVWAVQKMVRNAKPKPPVNASVSEHGGIARLSTETE